MTHRDDHDFLLYEERKNSIWHNSVSVKGHLSVYLSVYQFAYTFTFGKVMKVEVGFMVEKRKGMAIKSF